MRIEIHDKGQRVDVEDLTILGAQEMVYQCERLIEELQEHIDKEERAESDEK
jgi:hypothetical protein